MAQDFGGEAAVVFTVSNSGHKVLAENLALSAQEAGFEIAILALDEDTRGYLMGSHKVYLVPEIDLLPISRGGISKESADFGSRSYKSLSWSRYSLVTKILSEGFRAIYLDTDVVVRQDFRLEIEMAFRTPKRLDMVVQRNPVGGACMGVFAVESRAAERWRRLYSPGRLQKSGYEQFEGAVDQKYFNNQILGKKFGGLRVGFLPELGFPTGNTYRSNPERFDPSAFLVHYNGVVGLQDKVADMRQHGDWFI